MTNSNENAKVDALFKKVSNFLNDEIQFFGSLKFRWENEYRYEDPEDYKKVIREKALKYNLNVGKISLSERTQNITVEFPHNERVSVVVKILKTTYKVETKYR